MFYNAAVLCNRVTWESIECASMAFRSGKAARLQVQGWFPVRWTPAIDPQPEQQQDFECGLKWWLKSLGLITRSVRGLKRRDSGWRGSNYSANLLSVAGRSEHVWHGRPAVSRQQQDSNAGPSALLYLRQARYPTGLPPSPLSLIFLFILHTFKYIVWFLNNYHALNCSCIKDAFSAQTGGRSRIAVPTFVLNRLPTDHGVDKMVTRPHIKANEAENIINDCVDCGLCWLVYLCKVN